MSGSPSDPYSEGSRDAEKVLNLIERAGEKPVSAIWQKQRSGSTQLKRSLGEWAAEAKDLQGRWLQPVLENEAFEAHLIARRGRLQPRGQCESSFAWAQLLYALEIRPGKGILSWRPPSIENDPVNTGTVSLFIDGRVLCHIVNLYKLYTTSSARVWKAPKSYQLPFGILMLEDESTHSFRFIPGSEKELSTPRRPFQHRLQDEEGLREGHLKFDDDFVIAAYFDAVKHGVSDKAANLEHASRPLQSRVKSLLQSMELLSQPNWNKPYLVTLAWINEASRIKRRVTTEGGGNSLLLEHIYKYFSERPEIISDLKATLPKDHSWEDELKARVKTLCMFQEDYFDFVWNVKDMSSLDNNPRFQAVLEQRLPEAIGKLNELPEASWGRALSAMDLGPELVRVLKLEHKIVNRPVVVLQLVPVEWNFFGEIRDIYYYPLIQTQDSPVSPRPSVQQQLPVLGSTSSPTFERPMVPLKTQDAATEETIGLSYQGLETPVESSSDRSDPRILKKTQNLGHLSDKDWPLSESKDDGDDDVRTRITSPRITPANFESNTVKKVIEESDAELIVSNRIPSIYIFLSGFTDFADERVKGGLPNVSSLKVIEELRLL